MKKVNWLVVAAGLVVGAAAVLLTALGNPGNMGFCIACFLRDTSGALGLHSAGVVQYIRPEIIGIVLGSLIAALGFKEFKGRGGSSPALCTGYVRYDRRLDVPGLPAAYDDPYRRWRPERHRWSGRLRCRHLHRHPVPQEGLYHEARL